LRIQLQHLSLLSLSFFDCPICSPAYQFATIWSTGTIICPSNYFLQKLARKTWTYFEKFITTEDNWLPPDNYQELPAEKLAHRTSPTNMGISLLANLSAYDFGYISAGQLLERSTLSLNSMQSLDRYRGHFYNWYDTISLAPLSPHIFQLLTAEILLHIY
jgi:hypothetical protein